MSLKSEIVRELDHLNQAELELLIRFLAFIKFQARAKSAPVLDESQADALYAECGEEDRRLAEEGLADYTRGLDEEDRH